MNPDLDTCVKHLDGLDCPVHGPARKKAPFEPAIKTVWSIRPCSACGKGVKCEPGYPMEIRVVCADCIAHPPDPDVWTACSPTTV